jgi:predicted N-acetyltransferase YhbS
MAATRVLVRDATPADLDAIHRVQAASYSDGLVESREVFSAILARGISLVAVDEASGRLMGFLLAHPSERDAIYMLHHVPTSCDCSSGVVFVHDMSVLPEARGRGVGAALVRRFLDTHSERSSVQLMAVNGAEAYWSRFGFERSEQVQMRIGDEVVANYCGSCVYMTLHQQTGSHQRPTGSFV